MFEAASLFDLGATEHAAVFRGCEFAWEVLPRLAGYLERNLRRELRNRCEGRAFIGEHVFIGEGTVLEDGVMIKGPAIIGRNCQIRHNAYIRDNVIVGDNCVVGNASELKNSLLFNGAQVPHFNYVGDSVLGHKAHLGAGVKVSNFKVYGNAIAVRVGKKVFETGLRKFGALVGDHCEVGCNAVLNPGSILGRNSVVYANVAWRGVLGENMIAKSLDDVVERKRG
ncbi:MAG TPA: DapH/DapD/GlmU-related protein [Verrucomicrobiae bacterium]|jgi:NDP-sugar pyrophosphorylase family protein|nr:DapH/DapD/GlmU-related protein [Verrucomicrobiae bacterium]